MAHRPVKKTVESRLTAVERGIKSLQASDAAIIKAMRDGFARVDDLFAQVDNRFAQMENRLDQIYNHIDGFIKLHETMM